MAVFRARSEKILGHFIDFVPINESMLDSLVNLRNQQHAMYSLNQQYILSLDMQKEWYRKYLDRSNDIYWGIFDKQGNMVGSVRLYDITDTSCEHGSFIIDEDYAMGAPFALEAMVMSIRCAFDIFNVESIVCHDRVDNANMNSISKRFGFVFIKNVEINGVLYNEYVLRHEDSKLETYERLLNKYAAKRGD